MALVVFSFKYRALISKQGQLILFLLVFCHCESKLQNLVLNSSFEICNGVEFIDKIRGATHGEKAIKDFDVIFEGWSSLGWLGMPSAHSRKLSNLDIVTPYSGDYCVGMSLFAPASDDPFIHKYDFVDFLLGTLKEDIKKDSLYYIEFFVRRQTNWPNGHNVIHLPINTKDTSHIIKLVSIENLDIKLYSEIDAKNLLDESLRFPGVREKLQSEEPTFRSCELMKINEKWVKIKGAFKANTDAKYFILGNFKTANLTNSSLDSDERKEYKILSKGITIKEERVANYFIDDIIIRKANLKEFNMNKHYNCVNHYAKINKKLNPGKIYDFSINNNNPQRVSFVGRYDIAYKEAWTNCLTDFPVKDFTAAVANGADSIQAKNEIIKLAKISDGLLLNEAHNHSEHRAFLFTILDSLYDNGYKYLFIEALNNFQDIGYYNQKNAPEIDWGTYLCDPIFSLIIRKAKSLGITILPYEASEEDISREFEKLKIEFPKAIEDTMGYFMHPTGEVETLALGELKTTARERVQANNIVSYLDVINDGKFIIYGGGGHIDKIGCRYLLPMGYWIQEAMPEFKIVSACQISRFLQEDNATSHEPFVLKMSPNNYYTINKKCPGMGMKYQPNDITIVHSVSGKKDFRPDWLSLGGFRGVHKVDVPLKTDLPYIVFAYYDNGNIQTDVPVDCIEYDYENGGVAELFLPKGVFKIFLKTNDGKISMLKTIKSE